MFGRKRKRRENQGDASPTETYIGKGTRIDGTLVVSGSLRVDGEINGEIQAEGDVFVAESGNVQADVTARNLIVSGLLTGTASVAERLELLATGKIIGDAVMESLIVEQGGLLDGRSEMRAAREDPLPVISLDPAD